MSGYIKNKLYDIVSTPMRKRTLLHNVTEVSRQPMCQKAVSLISMYVLLYITAQTLKRGRICQPNLSWNTHVWMYNQYRYRII